MQVLDGKQTSLDIQQEIAQEVQALVDEGQEETTFSSYFGWQQWS